MAYILPFLTAIFFHAISMYLFLTVLYLLNFEFTTITLKRKLLFKVFSHALFLGRVLYYHTATAPSARGSVAPQSTPFSSRQMICPRPKVREFSITSISCPRRFSSSTISAGNVFSTWIFFPPTHYHLGASKVSCGFIMKSSVFMITCTCPWGCMKPPMTPNGPTAFPSFIRNPGMIV